jgi:hypothetical protein
VSSRIRVALLAALALSACKRTAAESSSPAPATLDEAEARLADNAAALAAEGIAVAGAGEPTKAETASEAAEDESVNEAAGDDVDAPQPTAEPADDRESVQLEASEESRAFKRRRAATRRDREAPRCERVCNLAEATCDLQLQICALADRHPGDIRYDDACDRAELQCDAAARECQLCAD